VSESGEGVRRDQLEEVPAEIEDLQRRRQRVHQSAVQTPESIGGQREATEPVEAGEDAVLDVPDAVAVEQQRFQPAAERRRHGRVPGQRPQRVGREIDATQAVDRGRRQTGVLRRRRRRRRQAPDAVGAEVEAETVVA